MNRPSAHRRGYGRRWQQIRKAAVETHVALYGWTCPGWGVSPHHTYDLTGDHSIPLSRGGLTTPGNTLVLCRGCNSRKRDRVPKQVQMTLDEVMT
jgi:5-methylcytosine-specific restriction endonuclease McrA